MSLDTKSRHLIVLGATSSLGSAICRASSKFNFQTRLGVSRKGMQAGMDSLVDSLACDLLSEEGISRFKAKMESLPPGRLLLISCLGYYEGSEPFLNTDLLQADRILSANYTANYRAFHSVLPYMCERKGGHILCFSCHSVHYAYPRMIPFSAAKAALEALVRGIANEFSNFNVQANAIRLSTLKNSRERTVKPFGDFNSWLDPDTVASDVLQFLTTSGNYVNGGIIPMFQYSDSFYNQSYHQRTRRK